MLFINDLKRHNLALKEEYLSCIERVINRGWFVLGQEVKMFEEEFARWCGVVNCVSLANGTDALELGLKALGIGAGDKVITVANAGGYSTTALLAIGATPVYVDINPQTLLISRQSLKEHLSPEIKAVIATHLYGNCCPVHDLKTILKPFGIPLIEDCAQAHGAAYSDKDSQYAGSQGEVGCFSFYPTKNLGALGDGGAVITNDTAITDSLRSLRQYGWKQKYQMNTVGGRNSRLDELQAALLRLKLTKIDAWNQKRHSIATRYSKEIHHPAIDLIPLPPRGVSHLFVVRVKRSREKLQHFLREQGILTEIHYPVADYRQPILAEQYRTTQLPQTEKACDEVLSLPCFPEMTESETAFVIETINRWKD